MQHEPRDRHYLGLMNHLAIPVLFVAACAVPEDLSTAEQGLRQCPEATCGFNSPEIDFNNFHELSKYGVENTEGFAITKFTQGGLSYQLEVANGELSGTRRGSPRLEHGALVGAQIWISLRGTSTFAIRVAGVGSVPFFAPPAGSMETYELVYGAPINGDPPRDWTNLCGGRWLPPDEVETGPYGDLHNMGNPETYGQSALEAILFDLDRIDMETKTLNSRPDSGWFNIGCAGHTLSKMQLTRNTIASQGVDYATKWAQRQATLKMLTADYCGDGTAFTVAGQRIGWQGGGMQYFSPPLALEARWSERGAECLDTPRMTQPSTPEGAAAFPDVETAIAKQCTRPPPCLDADPYSMSRAYRVSAIR